jgi:hypothetical protein
VLQPLWFALSEERPLADAGAYHTKAMPVILPQGRTGTLDERRPVERRRASAAPAV